MPIFLICIIVFVIWFRVKIKKANKETNIQNAQYWEREEQANPQKRYYQLRISDGR